MQLLSDFCVDMLYMCLLDIYLYLWNIKYSNIIFKYILVIYGEENKDVITWSGGYGLISNDGSMDLQIFK